MSGCADGYGGASVRFALLGSVEVWTDDGLLEVRGAVRRTLLAALLLHADTVVSAERLSEWLWADRQPASATSSLYNQVARLRRSLGKDGGRIRARAPGYLIHVEPGELDVHEFEQCCAAGRHELADGRWQQASEQCAIALALWRGEPLADLAGTSLREDWLPRLQQLHTQALEWRIEADLRLGLRGQLVPELRALVAEHPLRERMHAQLMLALAGAGRQAEALAAYQDARRVLIDELGIEPGPELQRLQERVLSGDAELLDPPRVVGASVSARTAAVPRQLPAAARHFVGRETELKALSELLPGQAQAAGVAAISAIGGTAGVGKTALAVHFAHHAAARFPDGQLYVNLRGFDPSSAPMEAADAARQFLDALGVPPERIPADPESRAALYRSLLRDRRMLVLLDNARDSEHVRPLLPGAPGCLAIVTSRNQLGGLVALDGAVPLTLNPLTEAEARDLLNHRLGGERLGSDEPMATELITLCARLPLALNIVAARAVLRPAWQLSELVGELRDARGRLDTLTLEDTAADVRAVFSWSYRVLKPEAARMFRLLGLHTGPDIGRAAAAALTGLDLDESRRALDALAGVHLLTEHAPGRYSLHDLLHSYAAEQACTHESEAERSKALRRVCDFYLHTTHTVDRMMAPHRPSIGLDPPMPSTRPQGLVDIPSAVAWLDAEHGNVLAAQHATAAHAWHAVVWQLAWTLTTFHRSRGLLDEQLVAWQRAMDSAAHLSDPASRIRAHLHLGRCHADSAHHEEAILSLSQALALAVEYDDPVSQAHTHFAFSRAWEEHGDDRQALHHAILALELCRGLNEPAWEADALNSVAWYAARGGDYDTARTHAQAALGLHELDDTLGSRANCLDTLAYIEHHSGHHHLAIERYQQALILFRDVGSNYDIANTLDRLGHPLAAVGRHEHARAVWRQALELYRQQDRSWEVERVQHQLDNPQTSI